MENKEIVLVTGGTGMIGKSVVSILKEKGYQVYILTRNQKKTKEKNFIYWNINKGVLDFNLLSKVDHIIHLSGANIIEKRWNAKRKKEIISSRIKTAELLFNKINELQSHRLKSFISASAVGYYDTSIINENREEDLSSNEFASKCCKLWENAADSFEKIGTRVVKLRIGIVVGNGTTISKVNNTFRKMRLLIGFGNGRQAFPWIHKEDLAQLFVEAISNSLINGVYNAVSPEKVNYNQFLNSIKKQNKIYLKINIPRTILQFLMGERSNLLLKANIINSEKIQKTFTHQFKHIEVSKAISA